MMEIRNMKIEDKETVLALAREFYRSDAVDHDVPEQILEQVFQDAISEDAGLRGVVLTEGTEIVGYSYMTQFYACEVAGRTLMLEEIFMRESCRGKGYGGQFFEWMFRAYPEVRRFRLEVTEANEKAVRLYERLGFERLSYEQMVLDRKY